jgi:hypothetical protein
MLAQSNVRTDALAKLRARVSSVTSQRLDDKTCLSLAIAAAVREPLDPISTISSGHIARVISSNPSAVALTNDEWHVLLAGAPLRETIVRPVVSSVEFRSYVEQIGTALRQTVSERAQGAAWERAWVQAIVLIAAHLESADEKITSIFGTLVRADCRRLEALYLTLDDDPSIMVLIQTILAVSSAIV